MLKAAVTALSASSVKAHGVAEQPLAEPLPALKPAKLDPVFATATRASPVPSGYSDLHVSAGPPSTLHWTVPVPVPMHLIVSDASTIGSRSKIASTVLSAFISTSHSLPKVLSHSPVHSVNSEPRSGSATSVSSVPSSYSASHSSAGPPSTSHSTVPVPVPPVSIVSSKGGSGSKSAVIASGSSMLRTHSLSMPEQSPDQLENSEPNSASAYRVSSVS